MMEKDVKAQHGQSEALAEELRAYFRKPEYTLPPYVESLFDRVEAVLSREAAARTEGRREGIEEAAKVAEGHNILADASEAHHMAASRAKAIAAAIRALAEKQP